MWLVAYAGLNAKKWVNRRICSIAGLRLDFAEVVGIDLMHEAAGRLAVDRDLDSDVVDSECLDHALCQADAAEFDVACARQARLRRP